MSSTSISTTNNHPNNSQNGSAMPTWLERVKDFVDICAEISYYLPGDDVAKKELEDYAAALDNIVNIDKYFKLRDKIKAPYLEILLKYQNSILEKSTAFLASNTLFITFKDGMKVHLSLFHRKARELTTESDPLHEPRFLLRLFRIFIALGKERGKLIPDVDQKVMDKLTLVVGRLETDIEKINILRREEANESAAKASANSAASDAGGDSFLSNFNRMTGMSIGTLVEKIIGGDKVRNLSKKIQAVASREGEADIEKVVEEVCTGKELAGVFSSVLKEVPIVGTALGIQSRKNAFPATSDKKEGGAAGEKGDTAEKGSTNSNEKVPMSPDDEETPIDD
jgi:hypothetical protein